MPDKDFFSHSGPQSVSTIAQICEAELHQKKEVLIEDIAALQDAKAGTLTFYHNTKYQDHLKSTQATACFIRPEHVSHAPDGLILLITPKPYRAYARAASLFYPESQVDQGISAQALISPTAVIGKKTTISPFCVIHDGAKIGDECFIDSHTVIGKNVVIGNKCRIESHVAISYSLIGDHAYIKTGARIGQKGFGFEMDESGHISVPQLGRVLIGDRVEIGANTTIDRGSGPDTQIGSGTRIDNLVQIGHNVVVGENCVLVAQVGIAGSTKLGKFVVVAGQVGISGHLDIGDGVRIAAQSGIVRNVAAGETIAGSPAVPVRDWHRQTIALTKMIQSKGK